MEHYLTKEVRKTGIYLSKMADRLDNDTKTVLVGPMYVYDWYVEFEVKRKFWINYKYLFSYSYLIQDGFHSFLLGATKLWFNKVE